MGVGWGSILNMFEQISLAFHLHFMGAAGNTNSGKLITWGEWCQLKSLSIEQKSRKEKFEYQMISNNRLAYNIHFAAK